jgi:hypothetical protein
VPAEVWRYSPKKITKLIITDEPMTSLVQDPYWETADTDQSDNAWPRKATPSRLELFKSQRGADDMMKDYNEKLKTKDQGVERTRAKGRQARSQGRRRPGRRSSK